MLPFQQNQLSSQAFFMVFHQKEAYEKKRLFATLYLVPVSHLYEQNVVQMSFSMLYC